MKTRALIPFLVVMALFSFSPTAHAGWTIEQVTHNQVDDRNPHMNNDGDIVWEREDPADGDSEIHFRLSDGSFHQLSDNDFTDSNPRMSDQIYTGLQEETRAYVVWDSMRLPPDTYDWESEIWLGLHDAAIPVQIHDYGQGPDINNLYTVAWDSGRDGLWTYDLRNRRERLVGGCGSLGDCRNIRITNHGHRPHVYWLTATFGLSEDIIWAHIPGSGNHAVVSRTGIGGFDVNDHDHLVWDSYKLAPYWEAIGFGDGGSEVVVIAEGPCGLGDPDLNNHDFIVWAGAGCDGGSDGEIYVYNPNTETTIQLTRNSVEDRNPVINDRNDIVWQSGEEGGREIYLARYYRGPLKQWAKSYGGLDWDSAHQVSVTPGGNYVVSGTTGSWSAGRDDFWVFSLDPDGSFLRQNAYGGPEIDVAGTVLYVPEEDTTVAAFNTQSYGAGNGDICLMELNQGLPLRQKTFGGAEQDTVSALKAHVIDANSWFFLAGNTGSFGAGGPGDVWLLKVDELGDVGPSYPDTWQKRYGTPEGGEHVYAMLPTSDNGAILVGLAYPAPAGNTDFLVLKVNEDGDVGASHPGTWQMTYGGPDADMARCVRQTPDGGYIVAGSSYSFLVAGLSWDVWVLKLDAQGEIEWQKVYGSAADDSVSAIEETWDGGYILAGSAGRSGPPARRDGWMMKIDGEGNIVWKKSYSGQDFLSYDTLEDVKPTVDNGYVAVGMTDSYGFGDREAWVLKTDENGEVGDCPFLVVSDWEVMVQATSEAGVPFEGTVTDTDVTGSPSDVTVTETAAVDGDVCEPEPRVGLARTGQTTSHRPGDDGELEMGAPWPAPRFTQNTDGTMLDNLTGLSWLTDANCANTIELEHESDDTVLPDRRMTWTRGLQFVAEINAGTHDIRPCKPGAQAHLSHDDWRVPNIVELESLTNFEVEDQAAWLNSQGFVNVEPGEPGNPATSEYWSSNTSPGAKGAAPTIRMSDGSIDGGLKDHYHHYIWPVRGGPRDYPDSGFPANLWETGQTESYYEPGGDDGALQWGIPWPDPRFRDNEDGTVTDLLTGLMWLKDFACLGETDWEGAFAAVADLNANPGGVSCEGYGEDPEEPTYDDWRVANRREFFSLVDHWEERPSLPSGHPFVNIPGYTYAWTSSTYAGNPELAWSFMPWFGMLDYGGKETGRYYAWPVRGGGSGSTVPVPDVKVNGLDGPAMSVSLGDRVQVTFSLDPGTLEGTLCDWVGFLACSYGVFPLYYAQEPLAHLPTSTVLDVTHLPAGQYLFLFNLDDSPGGPFTLQWFDYVVVEIL
jgi:hypothetical protein